MTEQHHEAAPWMITASGQEINLLTPDSTKIKLSDIATHLSRITRFNGAIDWSVAEHSLTVLALIPEDAEPRLKLASLLHDSEEAYVGDRISPLKTAEKTIFRQLGYAHSDSPHYQIEKRIGSAIREAFALPLIYPTEWDQAIAYADLQALSLEKEQLCPATPSPWMKLPEAPGITLVPTAAPKVRGIFINTALRLIAQRHGIEENS